MKTAFKLAAFIFALWSLDFRTSTLAFDGRITATLTRGDEVRTFLYTAGTNSLRIEDVATNRPHAWNVLDRQTGELTLIFPHNGSFVRLKSETENNPSMPPRSPAMAALPPNLGNQPQMAATLILLAGVGPTNLSPGSLQVPQMPQMPRMPAMPPSAGIPAGMPAMPMMMPPPTPETIQPTATGDKTNLLGFGCSKFEVKQRAETIEIWATDELLPFQPYLETQPHRFGPLMLEEQWGPVLKAKKLFPLLATLKSARGLERMRFEVKTVRAEKVTNDTARIFRPPQGYFEIQPLPF
jgi:hypothetical protein